MGHCYWCTPCWVRGERFPEAMLWAGAGVESSPPGVARRGGVSRYGS